MKVSDPCMRLYGYQIEAMHNLQNGSILCGGVGSGKSITSLVYYIVKVCNGEIRYDDNTTYKKMLTPKDLYIITTAKKRDSKEWEDELANVALEENAKAYPVNVVIDSWNNIKKYKKVTGAFFIFDEQRLVGSGSWVKTFLDISRKNQWILLSATPGDQWKDYIPVFIANGFYKNKTEFQIRHCVFSRYAKYPKIERYVGERTLRKNRDKILVPMDNPRRTVRHDVHIMVDYDKMAYKMVWKDRWDPYDNEPIAETGKLVYLLRRVVNSDKSRLNELGDILIGNPKVILFYNYNYELDMIKSYLDYLGHPYSEWNGNRHEEILDTDKWVYLVQYTAGCEGWNCITTDTIVFFSQTYSYRTLEQARGRIDRVNTPFRDLYYYHFHSMAPIDMSIHQCLKMKRKFNEKSFVEKR